MIKTLLPIFLTAISFNTYSQQVLSPSNFLKSVNLTTDTSETSINAWELPTGDFLFSYQEDIPYNQVPGWYMSSATLIKTDANGNTKAKFTVLRDTLWKRVHLPVSAFPLNDDIIFVVTLDSAVYNDNAVNKGLIAYHLDSGNLQVKSMNTFLNVLPQGSSYLNSIFLPHSNGTIYGALSYLYPFAYGNKMVKWHLSGNTIQMAANIDLDSMLYFKSNVNLIFNGSWDSAGDSIELFMNAYDSTGQQTLKLVHMDTALTTSSVIDFPSYKYVYSGSKYVKPDLILQGFKANDKIIAGPYFNNEVLRIAGLIKYDIATNLYEKVLVIPDSAGLSYSWKAYPLFGGLCYNNGDVYCMSYDFKNQGRIAFYKDENHVYIGKTDTSLNQWHWYKFIGFPNKHVYPYKALATSDGGVMITIAVWDYVNSPNEEHDIIIVKLDANGTITNINNLSVNDHNAVSLFPVPAQGELFINYQGLESFDLLLYSMDGKTALNLKDLNRNTHKIAIDHLLQGTYLYQIRYKSGRTEQGKVMKL